MTMRSTRASVSRALLTLAGITTLTAFPLLAGTGCSAAFSGNDAGNGTADDQDADIQGDTSIPSVPPPVEPDASKVDAHADAKADAHEPDADADADAASIPPDATIEQPDATIVPPDSSIPDAGQVPDVAVDANPCNAPVDEAAGVFVSPGGAVSACGSKSIPCGSVQNAITLASNTPGKSIVYLDRGTYAENINLAPGITIQGGWNDIGGAWTRQCTSDASSIAVLKGISSVAVYAIDFASGATATLDTLTVQSASNPVSNESFIGVFARGSATNIALTNVDISAAAAGNGPAGAGGGPGSAGSNDCPTPSDGASGPAGGDGAPAPGVTFASDGPTSTSGGGGTTGPNGHEGTTGTAPGCQAGSSKCNEDSQFGCLSGPAPAPSCGTVGTVGCGGHGGAPGLGGSVGGSSIALYAWGANVTVSGGSLSAGNGGQGGAGGSGGAGGAGGTGSAGQAGQPITTACTAGAYTTPQGDIIHTCAVKTQATGSAGGAGGHGGTGGVGGMGGGGAGGVSYAYVSAGGAALSIGPSTGLHHGTGGPGGVAPQPGPAGASGDHN